MRNVLVALALILLAPPFGAKERLQRRFDQRDGLPVAEVTLAQDSRGFIWIGSAGGLVRWDGQEMRRWVESRLAPSVYSIVACPGGAVFVHDDRGTVFEVVPEGLAPAPDAEGQPLRDDASIACDAADRLWAIAGGRIVHRDGARWSTLDSSALSGPGTRTASSRGALDDPSSSPGAASPGHARARRAPAGGCG